MIRPTRLVYTWSIEGSESQIERVTVRFDAADGGTLVRVRHEHVASEQALKEHTAGWLGCLEGLGRLAKEQLAKEPV